MPRAILPEWGQTEAGRPHSIRVCALSVQSTSKPEPSSDRGFCSDEAWARNLFSKNNNLRAQAASVQLSDDSTSPPGTAEKRISEG